MARWDDAAYGATAVRDYGSRVGIACFFAGLAFGVVFLVIGAASATRAIGATILALAALVNAWRTLRRAPAADAHAPRAERGDAPYLEPRLAEVERVPRLSPPHGSRTFQ